MVVTTWPLPPSKMAMVIELKFFYCIIIYYFTEQDRPPEIKSPKSGVDVE